MALSGSFGSNVGPYWRLQLEWTATQDISANTSTVTAKLYWMATSSGVGAVYASSPDSVSITVDGGTSAAATASPYLVAGQKKLIRQYTRVVDHNSDGTKTFNMSAYFDINATLSGTYYGRKSISGSGTLNTIPRASTLSAVPDWTAGRNLWTAVNRSSTSFSHIIEYFIKNTSNAWVKIHQISMSSSQNGVSSDFPVSSNIDIFQILDGRGSADSRVAVHTYNGGTLIGSTTREGTIETPFASTPVLPSYFNVGDAFTVNINYYSSDFLHTVRLKDGASILKSYTNVFSSVLFDTASIAATLRSIMSNESERNFIVEIVTYYEGVLVRDVKIGAVEGRILNSYPAFTTAPLYRDVNSVTTTITSNNQIIITDKSSVQAEVTVAGRAMATDGATMVRYVATLGGKTIVKPWSNVSAVIFDFGTISAKTNQTLLIRAEDSRGASTIVTKTVTMLPYDTPTLVASATRVNGFESNTLMIMSGRVSELKVGTIDKNYITAARFRFKETGVGTYGGWNGFVVSGFPNYTVTTREQVLDNTKSYDVQFEIVDRLSTVTVNRVVDTGKPLVAFDELLNSIGFGDLPSASDEIMVALQMRFAGNKWGADAGINMANSDIRGVNGIWANDPAGNEGEGINFMKTGSLVNSTNPADYETFYGLDGKLYYNGKVITLTASEIHWTGAAFLNSPGGVNQTIPLVRPLSQCPNGLLLLWSRYTNSAAQDTDWNFTFIPKDYNSYAGSGGGSFMWCHLVAANVADDAVPPVCFKKIFPRETEIIGNARNSVGAQSGQVLRAVLTI